MNEFRELLDLVKFDRLPEEFDPNSSIGSQIRALRKKKRWTQLDLGTRAKIHQSNISKMEKANPDSYTVATLKRVADALGVRLIVRLEVSE